MDREHQPRARHRPEDHAGVVWVNSTNLFDAAAGFGGYRESGFGREGGREGMWEYVKRGERRAPKVAQPAKRPAARKAPRAASAGGGLPPVDRTPKLFIAGQQARPHRPYTLRIVDPSCAPVGAT